MNKQKLFVASCLSIATASMVFAIRGDVAGPLSQAFHITNEQMGLVFSPAFWAFTIAIFISGNLVDIVGMRQLHILSAAGFIVGVALIVFAPHPTEPVVSLFDHTDAGSASDNRGPGQPQKQPMLHDAWNCGKSIGKRDGFRNAAERRVDDPVAAIRDESMTARAGP